MVDRADALEILGVREPATQADIDTARHAAMKVVHPQGSDPDEEKAKVINEAHRVATETMTGVEMVPVKALAELVRRNTAALERSGSSEAAATTVSQVVIHHVGELARARRRRLSLAVVTG